MKYRKVLQRLSVQVIMSAVFVVSAFLGSAASASAVNGDTASAEKPAEPVPAPEPLPIEKQSLPFSELAPTTTMSFEELVGDNGVYEDETQIPPVPAADAYKLVINEYHQFAAVYKKDDAGAFTVPVRYMVVSSGARKTPSPKGTFAMGDGYVRFGQFVEFKVFGQYWRQVVRNIYTHSLIYDSRNARSYTSSYNELGRRASHGCIRMLVPDARWIYYNLGPGTECEIVRGDKNDAEAAAIKEQLVRAERPKKRPALKPGEIPVTEAWPGWQGNAYAEYAAYIESLITPPESVPDEANA